MAVQIAKHMLGIQTLAEDVTIQSRLNWKKSVFQKVYDIWDIVEEIHETYQSTTDFYYQSKV